MSERAASGLGRFTLKSVPAVCLAAAIYFWFCYVAQGIAYGDLFGIPGREGDLAIMALHAREFLGMALLLEAVGVAMIAWFFSDDVKPLWQRFCFCVVLGSILDFFTYSILRGF